MLNILDYNNINTIIHTYEHDEYLYWHYEYSGNFGLLIFTTYHVYYSDHISSNITACHSLTASAQFSYSACYAYHKTEQVSPQRVARLVVE
jgi:hypothetical protein